MLADAGLAIPHTHDLGTLHGFVADLAPELRRFAAAFKTMDPYAVAIRYPGRASPWDGLSEAANYSATTMIAVRSLVRLRLGLDQPDA